MQMLNFNGKSIFFIGDSITANGTFLKYLRAYFEATGRNIFLHNKGIPGGTAAISCRALDEELNGYTPDFAVISLGINDIRYWEYSSSSEAAARLRIRDYYIENLLSLCRELRGRGVIPILCSPFCVNRQMSEAEQVETVVDNKEKSKIASSFYNRITFDKLNCELGVLRERIRALASEMGFAFFDMYADTYNEAEGECYKSDGIHYSEKGNLLIAKSLLKNMLGEDFVEYEPSDVQGEIFALEADERAYYFVKYNIMRDKCTGASDEELAACVRRWISDNGNASGLTQAREAGFFRFVTCHAEKQRYLTKLIRKEV